jgi:alpha-L-rhamnosidase
VGDLTSAKATYDSIHGHIVSDWKSTDVRFDLTVSIPANTTATVYVPLADPASIKEGRRLAIDAKGVKLLRLEDDHTVFEVGSGTYHFTAPR